MALASGVCLLSSQVLADVLPPIAPLEVITGDPLNYPIVWQNQTGKRVQIQLGNAPETAKLLVNNSGQISVSWNATPSTPTESSIEIIASDVDSGEVLDSEELLVRFVNKVEVLSVTAETGISGDNSALSGRRQNTASEKTPSETPSEMPSEMPSEVPSEVPSEMPSEMPEEASDDAPLEAPVNVTEAPLAEELSQPLVEAVDSYEGEILNEAVYPKQTDKVSGIPIMPLIANQVISAGRVVRLRIRASIPNGSPVELRVDRLPRDASFDANVDGSRTFFWQTGDRDQGEHVLRFTAINPNAPNQRQEQDVLIVVGDPSTIRTMPATNQPVNE